MSPLERNIFDNVKRTSHRSKKGSVFFDKSKGKFVAEIAFSDGDRCYSSDYRQDCEKWLMKVRGYSSAKSVNMTNRQIIEEIESMGDSNPKQIPGFPTAWISNEGNLYSTKNGYVVRRSLSHGKYYVLEQGYDSVSCTLEKLRYCVENNINPMVLKHCRLSVVQSENDLLLMNVIDNIRMQCRKYHERKWDNAERIIADNIEWNKHLLDYYRGDVSKLAILRQDLEQHYKSLENYVRQTLRITDSVRVKLVTEETISELLSRVAEKRCLVVSPLIYLEKLSRRINDGIREHHAKSFDDGNAFHVKCDVTRVSRKKVV